MGVYEQIKQAFQDIVAPEIKTLQSEIRRLDEKVEATSQRLDGKIDSLKVETESGFRRLEEKIESNITRLDEKIGITSQRLDGKVDSLLAIEIRERLVALEAKVR